MNNYIEKNKYTLVVLILIWIAISLTIIAIGLFIIGKNLSSINDSVNGIENDTHGIETELNSTRFKLDQLDYLKYLDPDKDFKDIMMKKNLQGVGN